MAAHTFNTRTRHGSRKMLYLVEQYTKAHPKASSPIDPDVVATWAKLRARKRSRARGHSCLVKLL